MDCLHILYSEKEKNLAHYDVLNILRLDCPHYILSALLILF